HDQGFGFVPDGLEGIRRSRALCTDGTRDRAASRVRTTYGGNGHGALAALRRWKLLPLALLDALSPAPLEERHDRCRDPGEEHEQEELLLLAALLLLFAHDVLPLLLPPAPGGCARPMAGTPTKRRSVGLDGLEPSTSSLSGMRSDRLSYRPESSSA